MFIIYLPLAGILLAAAYVSWQQGGLALPATLFLFGTYFLSLVF